MKLAVYFSRRSDAVHLWHHEIHDDDIRPQLEGLAHGIFAVFGLANDIDVVFCAEQRCQPHAHDRMVICQQDFDWFHGGE